MRLNWSHLKIQSKTGNISSQKETKLGMVVTLRSDRRADLLKGIVSSGCHGSTEGGLCTNCPVNAKESKGADNLIQERSKTRS